VLTITPKSGAQFKVGTSLAVCGLTRLAFAGQNPTGRVILAVLLLQADLVLPAIRFVRAPRLSPAGGATGNDDVASLMYTLIRRLVQ
jgi:hypothetical protein